MKKLLLLLLTSYSLMAEALPQTISTTIKAINPNGEITLANAVPQGMSGIVVHNYGNGLTAITGSIVTNKNGKAKLSTYSAIDHKNIPNIKTESQLNDKIIIGNFYNNALLIAPNANIYNKLTNKFKKTWIHPDRYALDFMKHSQSAITFDNLEKFAEKNQVGLVIVVAKEQLLVIDPISKYIIGKIPFTLNTNKVMNPFFARFKQMDTSVFGFSKVTIKEYYDAIASLEK